MLQSIGGAVGAVGTAGALSASATSGRDGATPGDVGSGQFEVDETDMPVEKARCWMVNGTDRDIDIYVNYADNPLITDIQGLSIGSVLTLDGSQTRPYGSYTFEARDKGDPDGPVLASASVTLDEGDSFSAVLHPVGGDDYAMSIYTNDYSASEEARFVVRHCAEPAEIDWQISQNGETPRVPDDPRSGTLERGEWQEATDVTEADYLMEVFVDGEVVTLERDLELEVETVYAAYVVGAPEPLHVDPSNNYEESSDSGIDEGKWILFHGFEVKPGDDVADTVTPPADPTKVADTNQRIEFDCPTVDIHETNVTEVELGATDPDGYVTGLAIDDIEPKTDSIGIVDNSIDRTQVEGGTTTATLRVGSDVPTDRYDVTVEANPNSLGARATCTVPVNVKPIPVSRLYDLVDRYQLSEDIDQQIATDLNELLDQAADHLRAGEETEACADLKAFLDTIGNHKDKGVSESAYNDLQTETKAVRTDIGCG